MEFKAISYEYESKYKKLLALTVLTGAVFYFSLFFLFFNVLYEQTPSEYGFFSFIPFIIYTPLLVESMVRRSFMKQVGKDKRVFLNADGIDVTNTVKGANTESHYDWSQIGLIEIIDMSAFLGKISKLKFFKLRIVFDTPAYKQLCQQHTPNMLEINYRQELASCCFDMEYTQAVMEEIKRYCNPEIVYRKKA